MISSKESHENHPIYVVDTEMGSAIFYNLEFTDPKDHLVMINQKGDNKEMNEEPKINIEKKEQWFTMHFDGACSKDGVGVGITISAPYHIEQSIFSYKFYFTCTNNIVDYEALILGLQILKKMQVKKVYIYGDFELVLRQVIGTYQAKHPRMRDSRNMVLDMLEGFEEYQIIIIPRSQNAIADTYAVVASTFRIPIHPNTKYTIEVKHRPAIPNNVKYWQVFEDDDHIESFLTLTDEFENMVIDEEEEGVKLEELSTEEPQNENNLLTHIGDKEIIQLKNNSFPKGLVPLEEMFDQNDVARTCEVAPTET